MNAFARLSLILVLAACARPRATADDSTAAEAHDPSMHAEHMAAAAATSATGDSAFTALQARGAASRGMGVDQYTSTHTFESTPDGGRITLQRDVADSLGAEQLRTHLRAIATAFAAGDFETPSFVHAGAVPGTDVMKARRESIAYRVAPLPRGGELRITTSDSLAQVAIHSFLAFQRTEHRVPSGAAPRPPAP